MDERNELCDERADGLRERDVYAVHGVVIVGEHRDECVDETFLVSREPRIARHHASDEVVEIPIPASGVLANGD